MCHKPSNKFDVLEYKIDLNNMGSGFGTVKISKNQDFRNNIPLYNKINKAIPKEIHDMVIKPKEVDIRDLYMEINHEDVINKMEERGWLWFVENYDYNINIIRG